MPGAAGGLESQPQGVQRGTTSAGDGEFIRALQYIFRHLGGVPRTPVIDNLKAGVARADWYNPELNPKVQDFCRHYGCVIVPARPYTPRHKGKVEAGVTGESR